jgi:hypothetical protein
MKIIGYYRIIEMYSLQVHEPAMVSWVRSKGSERLSRVIAGRAEEVYPPRYNPGENWQDHLIFALKYEGVNLEILSALFGKLPNDEIIAWINSMFVLLGFFTNGLEILHYRFPI